MPAANPSYGSCDCRLIPRDDLAFFAMNRQFARHRNAAAHQEFRAAGADRIGTAAARCGLSRAFVELREREQLAPDRQGLDEVVSVGADEQRNR